MTEPLDFIPKWDTGEKEVPSQSVNEMKNILLSIAKTQNKKVEQKGKK